MADTQIYNRDDIQRYLQYQMTAQEMHDFEKALMNDPFLADALEGFSLGSMEVTDKHLAEIRNELTGKMQAGKVVQMLVQKTAWWKVAAAILVVAAGGVVTYSLWAKMGDKENIAKQMASPKHDSIEPMEKPFAKMENLPEKDLSDKQENAVPMVRKEKQAVLHSGRKKTTLKDDYSINRKEENAALPDKNISSATTFNAPVIVPDKPAVTSKQTAMSLANGQNDLKDKITGEKDHINETASVYGYNNKRVISLNEYFASKAADSVSHLQAATTNYYSKNVAKSDTAADIVLNKTNQPFTGIAVTVRNEKNRKPDSKLLQQKTANDAEPIGGWKNFEQYLYRQTDSIKANDSDNHYSKNVEIEFLINNAGQPTNLKAMEKTDSVAIEKAVKILTNGPKWKSKKKDKKVKVTIPFE